MVEYIQKRDGAMVKFDKDKIVNAIIPAMKEAEQIDFEFALQIANKISDNKKNLLTVEAVQDMVEDKLMTKYPNVAKKYITYRSERTKIRNMKSNMIKQIKEKVHCYHNEFSNANVDEESFSARKNESAGIIMKEIALAELLDPEVKEKYLENELYIHDFTQYLIGDHNCLNVDEAHTLMDGFYTRNGGVRGARSISTAMQLVAVIFQAQSQGMFGGVGSTHIDYDLAPFVRMSFLKHFTDGLKYTQNTKDKSIKNFNDIYSEEVRNTASCSAIGNIFRSYSASAYRYAIDMLEKEGSQAAQALIHNLNTLESRPGGQLPFSSINFGLNTTFEGRCVIRWILEASLDGIGQFHSTPIFPISIWQYAEDINGKPGTPNYDLFQLSIKSTTKRIYPNYVNADWVVNKHDIRPINLISMPRLSNKCKIDLFKRPNSDEMATFGRITMEKAWDELASNHEVVNKDGYQVIDVRFDQENVYLVQDPDSHYKDYHTSPEETTAKINYMTKSTASGKTTYGITTDTFQHAYISGNNRKCIYESEHKGYVYDNDTEMATMGSCDGDSIITYKIRNDLYKETFEQAWDRICRYSGMKFKIKKKATYIDLEEENLNVTIFDSYVNAFVRMKKIIRNDDIGVWNKITLENGITEDNTIYLTDDHPLPTQRGRIFVKDLKETDKVYTSKLYTGESKLINVVSIEHIGFRNRYGYDVETVSDRFDVDFINSHNCRTLIGFDRHGMGFKKSGRGNVAPVTMNLVKLGIRNGICLGERKKADIKAFWNDLDNLLRIAEKSLIDRYKYIISQRPAAAYFMYENATINHAKESIESGNVEPSMKHNTLGIGFGGLSNMLYALFGKYQNQDKEVNEFGLEVVRHIAQFTKEASDRNDLNFVTYASPIENSCYTMMQKLQKEYGKIKGVTDRDYINNSYHVPVYEEVSIKEKLDIESEYSQYCTSGNIQYVEFDSSIHQNPKAVEKIIRYAMTCNGHKLAYFAINFPIDNCLNCGYSAEINGKCPKCGSDRIQRLRRVTGYLTADYKTRFNLGKRQEVEDRVKHSKYSKAKKEFVNK